MDSEWADRVEGWAGEEPKAGYIYHILVQKSSHYVFIEVHKQ